MGKVERINELINQISDEHGDTLIEDVKQRCYIQLQLLNAIKSNGYIDTANHRFIEVWNYNCEEQGWGKDNKI